jgi:hypothetical protein
VRQRALPQIHVGAAAAPSPIYEGPPPNNMTVVDDLNISFGVREITLDANTGMRLNGLPLKMRGFCDHSSFGGVGAAVPDRVQLFHAQALRAAGGEPSPSRA